MTIIAIAVFLLLVLWVVVKADHWLSPKPACETEGGRCHGPSYPSIWEIGLESIGDLGWWLSLWLLPAYIIVHFVLKYW